MAPFVYPQNTRPAVFNTGMVLDGWSAAFRATGDECYLRAGRRAANFLLADLDEKGHFRTHGRFVSSGAKTYNVLCAWSLSDLERMTAIPAAARRPFESLRLRCENSSRMDGLRITASRLRMRHCSIQLAPEYAHTIGYTLQGLLDTGVLTGRDDLVQAARRGAEPLIDRMSAKGFLHARFDSDWQPVGFCSCLTGSAQLAVVCYRLYQCLGNVHYREAADRLPNFLKAIQEVNSRLSEINGALPGSLSLLGAYMRAGYPNWATKFFLDALLLQEQVSDLRHQQLSGCRQQQARASELTV